MLVGLDICSTSRMARLIKNSPFVLEEVFSEDEISYCSGRKYPERHFAARWSAKEAFLKALGLGVLGYDLSEIEVVHGDCGKPSLNLLSGDLRVTMHRILDTSDYTIQLSLSHELDYSIAVVVIL